jgi:hypothetical protein
MARYHLNSVKVNIPANGTINVPFGPESSSNVCENISLWLEGQGVATWTIKLNGVATANTGAFVAGVAKKVWTEAGPLATMVTYPSVDLTNAAASSVLVVWTALIRQDNG